MKHRYRVLISTPFGVYRVNDMTEPRCSCPAMIAARLVRHQVIVDRVEFSEKRKAWVCRQVQPRDETPRKAA